MSQKYVQNLWTDTQIKLSRLLTSEINGPKGFDSKRKANDYVRRLFIEYNEMMKKLDEIYQTTIHPQKRLIIRILLDGIVGRLVELKEEMIKFDYCEYTYFEDLAFDHKKTFVRKIKQSLRNSQKKLCLSHRTIFLSKFLVIFLKVASRQ